MKFIIEMKEDKSIDFEASGVTEANIYEAIGLLEKMKFELLNLTKDVEEENAG